MRRPIAVVQNYMNPNRSSGRSGQHFVPFMTLSIRHRPLVGILSDGFCWRNPPCLPHPDSPSVRQSTETGSDSDKRLGLKEEERGSADRAKDVSDLGRKGHETETKKGMGLLQIPSLEKLFRQAISLERQGLSQRGGCLMWFPMPSGDLTNEASAGNRTGKCRLFIWILRATSPLRRYCRC